MIPSMRFRLSLLLAFALVLAGCEGPCSKIAPIAGPKLDANGVDFTTYVAVGTSISAGEQSGGLVNRHQVHAFPALFAQQVGHSVQLDGKGQFSQPVYDRDGFPQLLHITSYVPLVITNTGRTTGNATNLAWPKAYNDMAVPFAIAFDFVDTSFYYNNFLHPDPGQAYFNNIVRHTGTIAENALSLAPTFLSYEYGSNEVLGFTSEGQQPPLGIPGAYAQVVTGSLDLIHAVLPNAKIAVFNVPDVTSIPFVTTLSPFTVSLSTGTPVPLLGTKGALDLGDFVLLTAADSIAATGKGIPVGALNYLNPLVPGSGRPLTEDVILRSDESDTTRIVVGEMNDALSAEAAARPYVALVDMNRVLNDIAANGLLLGGHLFTTKFVKGGLFSLDGVHPNDLAHAVLCNAMIDAVNARFGSHVPRLDPLDSATPSSSRAEPWLPSDAPALPTRIDGLRDVLPKPMPFLGAPSGLMGRSVSGASPRAPRRTVSAAARIPPP